VIKFRTMHVDAEARQKELEDQNEVAGAAFKMADDPRVTRVGKVLRKLSLDELPQFWNVFSGDMSLVGPRPLPMRDVEEFDRDWQYRRFSVKPGLTCLWQVHGRHEIDFDNWMELDLQYIDNWSLSLDFDILLKTLPAALRGTGAS
jgi:lipopolysaccharide/colanic/teichoic acid biosynthesis glycosyltransferase